MEAGRPCLQCLLRLGLADDAIVNADQEQGKLDLHLSDGSVHEYSPGDPHHYGLSGFAQRDLSVELSGDEKLKSFTPALKSADYHLTFPDDTPVKVFRRGTLSCAIATGKCGFVLTLPDDVRTVD